jgi:predicted regulator of Ras-like GTPase activity (Roadblock/LC7/MglB family)
MDRKKMSDNVLSFALKGALDEIQSLCPDITNAFIFKEDGEVIAKDEDTEEKNIKRVVNVFEDMFEKADAIGGVKYISIDSSKGKINIHYIDDLCFLTVTSEKADVKYVNTVTRVLIPTILRVLKKIHSAPLNWGKGEQNSINPSFPL